MYFPRNGSISNELTEVNFQVTVICVKDRLQGFDIGT